MADPSTAIAAAPFVADLQPYLTALVTAVIGIAVPWGFSLLQRYTGVAISQADQEALSKAAQTQAGIIVAKADGSLAGVSIDAKSPAIATAANWVAVNLPSLLTKAGATPDDVSHMILAEIGKLQAQMTAPVAQKA